MAQLIVINAADSEILNKGFYLSDGDIIGNNEKHKIYLKSQDIKTDHIKINIDKGIIKLTTLNPRTQFAVNGESLQKAQLSHGDIINIEDYTLIFNNETRDISTDIDKKIDSEVETRIKYNEDYVETLKANKDSEHRLFILYKITKTISGILDLDHLLKELLKIILKEFSASRGFILLYDNSKKKLIPAAVLNRRGENINPKISESIVKQIFSTRESILCKDIKGDDRFKARESLIGYNVMSTMCVPLIWKDEILGLIQVDSQHRSKFGREDLQLLTQVATQAAIILENAKYVKARQEFNQNLLTLSKATQCIASYLQEDLIINDTVFYINQIFKPSNIYFFLKKNGDLKLVSESLNNREKLLVIPESIKELANNNKSFLFTPDDEIPQDLKNITKDNCSLLIVPLVTITDQASQDQKTVGIFCITSKQESASYSLEDKELLNILASYTAIALSNAKFYEELKNKEQEIAKWNLELEKRVDQRTKELESIQGKLVQSEKMAAVGLLAAGVSHEFNNIIASMYGFAQIATRNKKYESKLVQIVIEQCKRACKITESLLSFSKQKGEIAELVNIHELIERVLNLTKTALENEGITIIKEFNELPKTMVNVGKIQQVFTNLIINARHAIEKNGTITISTFFTEDTNQIHITFEDTGAGIKEKNLARIFEPFYTTKGSFGGGTQPGTGMGLSVCYNIVKVHGGNITVTSEKGKGSYFKVSLPVTTTPPKNMKAKKITQKISLESKVTQKQKQKLLIVEDSETIRNLLVTVLEDKNFEVLTARDGEDAIEVCRKNVFTHIFLDISMPGSKDGFDVFDEVKKTENDTKIVLLTGRFEDPKLMDYVQKADGYLRKPFELDDIEAICKSLI